MFNKKASATLWIGVIIIGILIVGGLNIGLFAVSADTYNGYTICSTKVNWFDWTKMPYYNTKISQVSGLVGYRTSMVWDFSGRYPAECRDRNTGLDNDFRIGGDGNSQDPWVDSSVKIVGLERSGEKCYVYYDGMGNCYTSLSSFLNEYFCVYDYPASFGGTYRLRNRLYIIKGSQGYKVGEAKKYNLDPCSSGTACLQGRTDGQCVVPCTDPDGINRNIKGTTTTITMWGSNPGATTYYYDSCTSDKTRVREYRCKDGGVDFTYWNSPLSCTYGCENGACKTCADECTSGQVKCSGQYKQTCGNFDADSCLEWGSDFDCGMDSTGTYGNYYCKDSNTQARDRTITEKGCLSGGCTLNEYLETETITCDTLGCDSGTGKCKTCTPLTQTQACLGLDTGCLGLSVSDGCVGSISCPPESCLINEACHTDSKCYDAADTNFNGEIDRDELGVTISKWILNTQEASGIIPNIQRLKDLIPKWKQYILIGGFSIQPV